MNKKFFEYGKSFSRMGMAVVAALALTTPDFVNAPPKLKLVF